MFSYTFIKKPDFSIDTSIIDNIFKNISNIVNKEQNGTINIVFLDDNSIKNLNNKYRGIDEETDVLSFHYFDDFSELEDSEVAGEVIMSENKINSQGIEYSLGSEKEFYKLIIHSLLHILGYDHESNEEYEMMQSLEDKIIQSCKVKK